MNVTLDDLATIGARVAAIRKERNLSYRDVAAATGLSIAALHRIEHDGNPRLSTVLTLLNWIQEAAQ